MTWRVMEDGRDPVACATLADARQYVEDRAVECWDALRDPNEPGQQPYPGLDWNWSQSERAWIGTMGRAQWKLEEQP